MALIKCYECGHMISDKAKRCPKCGAPIQKSEATTPTENEDKVASVVESKVNEMPKEENQKVEADILIADIEKPQRSKEEIAAIIFGIFVVTVIMGGYYLWQNDESEYIPLNIESVKSERNDNSIYSIGLVERAEKGDADAQYNLGVCYYNGYGDTKDYGEAVKWYRKAAEQGHADAQNNLGVCYYNGYGVAQDYGEAVKWYKKAAEQGHVKAIKFLN